MSLSVRIAWISTLTIVLCAGVAVAVAAQDSPVVPAPFSASLVCRDEVPVFGSEGSEEQVVPGITVMRLGTPTWSMIVEEASDARLEGDATFAMNGDLYWEGPSVAEAGEASLADVMVARLRIENAGGSWDGTTYLLSLAPEHPPEFAADVIALAGAGGYEGVVALTELRQGANVCRWDLQGVVIERGLPPVPELPAD